MDSNALQHQKKNMHVAILMMYLMATIFAVPPEAIAEPKDPSLKIQQDTTSSNLQTNLVGTNQTAHDPSLDINTNFNALDENSNGNTNSAEDPVSRQTIQHKNDGVEIQTKQGEPLIVIPHDDRIPPAMLTTDQIVPASYTYLRTAQDLVSVPKNIPYLSSAESSPLFDFISQAESAGLTVAPVTTEETIDRYKVVLEEKMDGIPIEHQNITLHIAKGSGKVIGMTGALPIFHKDPTQTPIEPLQGAASALKNKLIAKGYQFEDDNHSFLSSDQEYFIPNNDSTKGIIRLGYRFQANLKNPFGVWEFLIDASDNTIISAYNTTLLENDTGSGSVITTETTIPAENITVTETTPASTQPPSNENENIAPLSSPSEEVNNNTNSTGEDTTNANAPVDSYIPALDENTNSISTTTEENTQPVQQTIISGQITKDTDSTTSFMAPFANLKIWLSNITDPLYTDASGSIPGNEHTITKIQLSSPDFSIIDDNFGGIPTIEKQENNVTVGTGSGNVLLQTGSGTILDSFLSATILPLADSNAFYYVNKTLEVARNLLGITPPASISIITNSQLAENAGKSCSAFTIPSTNTVYFGRGNCPHTKNLALSSDIIYHEMGHVLVENLKPFGQYNSEVAALREGISDYFAASQNNNPLIGESVFPSAADISQTKTADCSKTLAYYFGANEESSGYQGKCSRNDPSYLNDLTGEPHTDGRIISSILWDLNRPKGLGGINPVGHNTDNKVLKLLFAALHNETDSFDMLLYNMLIEDDSTAFGGDNDLSNGSPDAKILFDIFYKHGIGPGYEGWLQLGFTPTTPPPSTETPSKEMNICANPPCTGTEDFPTVSFTGSPNSQYTNQTSFSYSVTCTKDIYNLASCGLYVSVNGGLDTLIAQRTSSPWSLSGSYTMTSGNNYKFTAQVVDIYGWEDEVYIPSSTTMTVDTAAPTVYTPTSPAYANAAFTVSWTAATDTGGSGLSSCVIQYSDNGGAWTTWSGTNCTTTSSASWSSGVNEHTYAFREYALDGANNSAISGTSSTIYDTAAPTGGSFTINSNATYTNSTSVTLNITCPSDSWTPIQMAYGNAASPTNWTTCSSSQAWTLSTGDGTKTVYMRFRDGGGNTTSDITDTIILDTTAPTSNTISINSGAAYTNNPTTTLTLSSTDTTSGVSQMQFSCDNSNWTTAEAYATTKTFNITNQTGAGCSTGDGTKTVYVKYKDNAGNWSTAVSDSIIYDTTGPTTTDNASSTWTSTDQTITLTPTDTGSGMSGGSAGTWYCVDTTGTCTPTTAGTSVTVSCTAGTTCPSQYVRYYSKDAAGNTETTKTSVVIKIDKQAPSVPTITAEPTYTAGLSNTVTSSTVTDAGVGGVQYQFCRNTSNTTTGCTTSGWSGTASATFNSLTDGQIYYYFVQAKDSLGNTSAWSTSTFSTQDNTGPTVSGSATALSSTSIQWTITASDSVSGLNTTAAYSFDGTNWVTSNTLTESSLTPNTQYTKSTLKARDNVLNVSTASSVSKYTLAQVPVAPTTTGGYTYTNGPYVNVTLNTETPANPVTTVYAIYIEQGATCDGSGGLGYVQTDGSIGPSAVWQTISSWGTKTVPHLTQATQYALCSKARNGDNVETTFGATATVTSGAPTITLSLDSTTKSFTLIPGTPNTTTSTITITNDGNGYVLTAQASTTTTLKNGSYSLADISATPTTSISWPGANYFGYRLQQSGTDSNAYNSSWWGSDASPKYAGFSTTAATIANKGIYSASSSVVNVEYKGQVDITQVSGNYSGTITYTVVPIP